MHVYVFIENNCVAKLFIIYFVRFSVVFEITVLFVMQYETM